MADAAVAYEAGATGAGVKIGIVDYGTISPEIGPFVGRVDPASRDLVGSGREQSHFHGPAVASVAAANRDGVFMHGVAFQASILGYNVAAASCTIGNCTTHFPAMIEAIDLAVANGARVINFSAGPGVNWQPEQYYAAMQRAAEAGVVLVFAAGNNGGGQPIPHVLEVERRLASFGNVLIVGAHDQGRQMASFSDRGGDSAAYIAALGVNVPLFDHLGGTQTTFFGTSFSAPAVAGAVALVAGAFPHLTAREIVQILLTSADDAGAPGRDPVFGNGILNIGRAFQPLGATSIAGGGQPVSLFANGALSAPMGDARPGEARVTILDGFARAFTIDLATTVAGRHATEPLLEGALGGYSTVAAEAGPMAVTLTALRGASGPERVRMAALGLTEAETRRAKAIAGTIVNRIAPGTAVALGFSESGSMVRRRLAGEGGPPFLAARDPAARLGFHERPATSFGLRQALGPVAVTVTSERGEVADWRDAGPARPGYGIASIVAERRQGGARFWVGASRLDEESSLLGARFADAFRSGGARTLFLDAGADVSLGRGWSLSGSYRRGETRVEGTGALVERGRLNSDAFALDIAKAGLLSSGDALAFRLAQPLRVRSGGFDLNLPVSYDHGDGSVAYAPGFLNLAPAGRERVWELAYGGRRWGGWLELNAFLRSDPGHFEKMPGDAGGAVRFALRF